MSKNRDLTAAKKAFLNDLRNDPDFIQHKRNAQWKQEEFSPYLPQGFYTTASGTFGVANVNNDLRKKTSFN